MLNYQRVKLKVYLYSLCETFPSDTIAYTLLFIRFYWFFDVLWAVTTIISHHCCVLKGIFYPWFRISYLLDDTNDDNDGYPHETGIGSREAQFECFFRTDHDHFFDVIPLICGFYPEPALTCNMPTTIYYKIYMIYSKKANMIELVWGADMFVSMSTLVRFVPPVVSKPLVGMDKIPQWSASDSENGSLSISQLLVTKWLLCQQGETLHSKACVKHVGIQLCKNARLVNDPHMLLSFMFIITPSNLCAWVCVCL